MLINLQFNYLRSLNNKPKQQGFSMLEVLITMVVLSFGLLGLAALVTTGMRSNNVAHYRSVATQQTLDIADRMRANLVGVRAGSYDVLGNNTPVIPAGDNCMLAVCDATQIATYDHAQWNQANAALLPGGAGEINGNLATSFVITMMWTEKEMGGVVDPNLDPACPGTVDTRCFSTRFSP